MAINNAMNDHVSKSVGKPSFTQKRVIEMQKKYIKEYEKSRTPERSIINQKKADEFFKNECRSRDASRSPTATF
jgi:hypothetical protein